MKVCIRCNVLESVVVIKKNDNTNNVLKVHLKVKVLKEEQYKHMARLEISFQKELQKGRDGEKRTRMLPPRPWRSLTSLSRDDCCGSSDCHGFTIGDKFHQVTVSVRGPGVGEARGDGMETGEGETARTGGSYFRFALLFPDLFGVMLFAADVSHVVTDSSRQCSPDGSIKPPTLFCR